MSKNYQALLLSAALGLQLLMYGCTKKETVNPIVVEMTLEKSNVALLPSGTINVNINSGNGEYKAISSNDDIAKATVSGNIITITAGTNQDKAHAYIVITDKMFKRQSIDVEVSKLFDLVLSKTQADLEVGITGKNEVTININSGNAGYQAEAIENTASLVEINKTKIETYGKLTIKALAAGTAKVKVTDAKGKEAIITLNITAPTAVALSKTDITLAAVQASTEINITAGNGDYKVSVANPLIAKAYIIGTVLTIKGKINGTTVVTIEDKKGQKATVNVKVDGAAFAMNLSDQYFGYANFNDIAIVDVSVKSVKTVTFELTCKIDGYRGLQTFIGLEGNLLIRGKNDDFRPTHPLQIVGLGDKITLESTSNFNLNQWMNIALVVDCNQTDVKEKYKLYINGVQDVLVVIRQDETHTSINLASSSDGNRFEIGRAVGQDFRAMKGTISEARVWTVARTAQQIKDNMCGLTGATNPGLLARWNFTAGAETGYIQDSNGGKYETNLILANAKAGGSYTQVKAPASVFVSKGCPN
ncbi:LamG-like jellyroll fold domain-containing protein [Mucilaginibacter antarcticus]|uniref:LamG-like jellyroll fold domain-containing protein n=1 Tax=Mucilaginibacter antarcticus TaxID=1855725 RepID=A0ABW5XKU0_9SPHI